ncbi:hypothetical protein [Chitiniphilus eburneus]|uniref:Uncharacterized protein n=1 Tax=Chitiniphilus eburneus TaxID=2571148 RepID=A0A4U0Q3L8_9NEIS|nr:hypothetical protein [Chitiniphilus eburneus]TJZ75676.1 hypothetical protein FAZ21_07135 [Chitiniphilus eburneus]
MDRLTSSFLTHRCGHTLQEMSPVFDQHEAYLIRAAFPCPHCMAELARRYELQTRVYTNMQQVAPGMAAFVVEVSRPVDELGDLLSVVGYGRRRPSLDELNPGGTAEGAADEVWRKEFWFATNTDPLHVVALVEHIKLEMNWLGGYLPAGMGGVEFCKFPE